MPPATFVILCPTGQQPTLHTLRISDQGVPASQPSISSASCRVICFAALDAAYTPSAVMPALDPSAEVFTDGLCTHKIRGAYMSNSAISTTDTPVLSLLTYDGLSVRLGSCPYEYSAARYKQLCKDASCHAFPSAMAELIY